jgi:hypothetical protein
VKGDSSELSRVGKNQAPSLLSEDNMIVPAGDITDILAPQFAGHAEVHTDPGVAGLSLEVKEHPFPMGA